MINITEEHLKMLRTLKIRPCDLPTYDTLQFALGDFICNNKKDDLSHDGYIAQIMGWTLPNERLSFDQRKAYKKISSELSDVLGILVEKAMLEVDK